MVVPLKVKPQGWRDKAIRVTLVNMQWKVQERIEDQESNIEKKSKIKNQGMIENQKLKKNKTTLDWEAKQKLKIFMVETI